DLTTKNNPLPTTKQTFVNRLFREVYGPFLLNKKTKLYIFLCYSLYLLFALLGVSHMEEGLHPKELVKSSFYLTDFYVLIDETFWREGLQLQVVVNNPPNFVNFTQRQRLNQLVSSFEDTEFTMKHNATMFWLNAFDAKIKEDLMERNISEPKTLQEWHQRCLEWLLSAGGRRLWELDMHWIEGFLVAFRFQIGLRNYRTPTEHTNGCRLMRSIADSLPEFNVTTFHEYYPFSDQYIELKPALYRNCLIAVMCMGFIALLMIPSWPAAFFIIAAIVSIDIGVIGYMSLWGVNLESVSMITIIMSIGFSVDLSAHITYAFVKAPEGLSSNERAIAALETLGWPVFLGAFSTVVGIMVLTLVDAVIILIFFKTVFLVIIFSLLHGIVFLPILLTVAMPNEGCVCQIEDGRK
uniref:SSD domain-containing protein n=1 Tax=Meloidogyne floridensis TaxID=298350 RepID=A0A915NUP6_9BILA